MNYWLHTYCKYHIFAGRQAYLPSSYLFTVLSLLRFLSRSLVLRQKSIVSDLNAFLPTQTTLALWRHKHTAVWQITWRKRTNAGRDRYASMQNNYIIYLSIHTLLLNVNRDISALRIPSTLKGEGAEVALARVYRNVYHFLFLENARDTRLTLAPSLVPPCIDSRMMERRCALRGDQDTHLMNDINQLKVIGFYHHIQTSIVLSMNPNARNSYVYQNCVLQQPKLCFMSKIGLEINWCQLLDIRSFLLIFLHTVLLSIIYDPGQQNLES